MNEKRKKTFTVFGKMGRLLGALPAIALGIAIGLALYWGLAPANHAGPATTEASASTQAASAGDQKPKAVTWWTCSMHPEVRLPHPGLCPKCGMKLIPLKENAGGGMRVYKTTEAAEALMNIETAPVEKMFPTAEIRMVGKVDYDETRLAYITAWVPGRLDRLFVDYTGIAVRKGDHMVYIYSPDLYSAQEELIQAIQAVKNLGKSDVGIVLESSRATVDAAREKLRLLGLTDEQVAAVEKSGKADDHVTIFAPVSGIVIHKNAQEGMYVKTGTRIYTIADLSQVWVKLDAYESDLSWLRYGQKVEFASVSYPGETFAGTIAFIDPILNPVTRTVKVRVNVPNPQGKLKPDMFVNAVVHSHVAAGGRVFEESLADKWMCPMHPEIVKDSPGKCDICGMPLVKAESLGYVSAEPTDKDKPLVIPVSAALLTGTRAIVYVKKPDANQPTFEGREVVLGPRAGGYYLVRRGLSEGERVVTRGNFKIDSALQIQAKPSMMTPDGGGGSMGHHHGGPAKKADGADKVKGPELPVLFSQQLKDVLAAAGRAQQATQVEDLDKAKSAFAALGKTIEAVGVAEVQGHPKMLWEDLAMRLGNDAFEGRTAKTIAAVRVVAQSLAENAASLRKRFALEAGKQAEPAETLPEAFREQLDAVFAGYFGAAEAMSKDDAKKAADDLKAMSNAIDKVDMHLLSGEAHMAWMKHKKTLVDILAKVPGDKDIKKQRELLASLSEEAASLARRFPPARASAYYLVHCPMAFDGRGAVWLQDSQEVHNPYFGSAMPGCGEVQEMICGQDTPTSAPASTPAAAVEH